MAKEQVFTLEEINALIPRLQAIVNQQLTRRTAIEDRLGSLKARLGSVPDAITIEADDPEDVRDLKLELLHRIEEYQATWRTVEELGAVLKDARSGLLDFYGQVDGKLVWFCWKHGESEITHYHALDEGFSGRREIRHSAKHRLIN
jgi:hypothetical protein